VPGLTDPAALRRGFGERVAPVAHHRTLGLAVSGGADSLALMLLAAEWAAQPGRPKLTVYSVDHGLRPEAADEVAFVLAEAARLGLPARGLRWEGEKPATGLQAAARVARYRLLAAALRQDGGEILLTAHHRDDQAETVVMRLAHGSGLEGLRGMDAMSEMEGLKLFRPLLDVPHAGLAAVVAAAGIVPVTDPSNADPNYERVRWRQALPALADLGLDAGKLATLAQRAGEADAALTQWAGSARTALVQVDALGAARLPAPGLAALPKAVAVKLLGGLVAEIGGGARPYGLGAMERLWAALASPDFSGQTLGGVVVHRRGGLVWLAREPGRRRVNAATVSPRHELAWDRRFRIANLSAQPIVVRMAGAVSRAGAEAMTGQKLAGPAVAIRAAPLVEAADGRPLALGCYRFSSDVAVEFLGSAAQLPQP